MPGHRLHHFTCCCPQQLSAVHEQYHRVKCHLVGPDATTPSPALNVIQDSLVQYLTKSVTAYEDWRKHRASGKKVGYRE